MRLLLLEDDLILGEGLRDFLRSEGHGVEWADTLGAARVLVTEPFDALLVDWQLPDGSGQEWVSALRRQGVQTPILMLTARDLLSDRIRGLDSGADDYLVKPFEPEELVARLHAVRRRSAGTVTPLRRFGAVELDVAGRSAWRCTPGQDRVPVPLTGREWLLLEALVHRAGRVVSRSDLESLVLGTDTEVSSNVLEVHMAGLRRKLGRDLIETVRGLGYRFVMEVVRD